MFIICACTGNSSIHTKPAIHRLGLVSDTTFDLSDPDNILRYCGDKGIYRCSEVTHKTAADQGSTNLIYSRADDSLPVPDLEDNFRKSHVVMNAADPRLSSPGNSILFDFNSSLLDNAALRELEKMTPTLNQSKIELMGYTDSIGGVLHNNKLAIRRAKAVREFFIKKGLLKKRIHVNGFGKCCYIASNATKDSRRLNRRVEIHVFTGK